MSQRGKGLHRWPAGELERRLNAERKAELAEARKFAKLVGDRERREGKTYLVLRLPDDFDHYGEAPKEFAYHRPQNQVTKDAYWGKVS